MGSSEALETEPRHSDLVWQEKPPRQRVLSEDIGVGNRGESDGMWDIA